MERVGALGGKDGGVGIVIGMIGPRGRRVMAYGQSGAANARPLDGRTAFEIGSVTKVFTALLLADMARTGDVALTDPVAKYLPAGAGVPARGGRSITLLDLATHTSGLPFMPVGLPDMEDSASARYSVARLYDFLAHYELSRDIGAEWEYSNLGYWLLGQALASRAGTSYEQLLRTRVLAPLHSRSTAFAVSPTLRARLAMGHNGVLQPAPMFSSVPGYNLMPAAGGLVSTADDLLSLLSVAMGYDRSPLTPDLAMTVRVRRPMGTDAQALGWTVIGKGGDELIVQDGGTFGYASSVAWDPTRRVGVVVLSNQVAGVGDIARHLLRPNIPLEKPTATKHTEIALDPSVADIYVGRYEARDEGVFVIAHTRGYLTIQAPADWGLPRLHLRPVSTSDFYVAELPLRVAFQTDGHGNVSGMLVYPPRGQHVVAASRLRPER